MRYVVLESGDRRIKITHPSASSAVATARGVPFRTREQTLAFLQRFAKRHEAMDGLRRLLAATDYHVFRMKDSWVIREVAARVHSGHLVVVAWDVKPSVPPGKTTADPPPPPPAAVAPRKKVEPTDKLKLVELVEVVVHKGTETNRAPSGRKQYINLDDNVDPDKPHPEYGRVIRLRARVEWESGDKSKSCAGHTVYWYLTPGAKNRAGLTGTEKEGLGGAGAVTKTPSTSDAKGWTDIIELHCSLYGGDQFDVHVTEDSGYKGGMKAGTYEVWRRMWFEVTEMKTKDGKTKYALPGGVPANVQAALQKVYVELQNTGKRNTGEFVDNFANAEDAFKWADKYCSSDGVPWKVHYAVVHHSATKTSKTVEVDLSSRAGLITYTFRPYDFDGMSWLVSADWRYKTAGATWTAFSANEKATLQGTNPSCKIKLDFSTSPIDPSRTPVVVRVEFLEASPANGWGGTCLHLAICRGTFDEYYSASDVEKTISGTCIHEPGHSLGLVDGKAWETADASHSAHCKFRDCVMWWQGYVGRPHDYHPTSKSDPGCHTFVRGKDMSRGAMQSGWKFPR
jgi:hypothetical protein